MKEYGATIHAFQVDCDNTPLCYKAPFSKQLDAPKSIVAGDVEMLPCARKTKFSRMASIPAVVSPRRKTYRPLTSIVVLTIVNT